MWVRELDMSGLPAWNSDTAQAWCAVYEAVRQTLTGEADEADLLHLLDVLDTFYPTGTFGVETVCVYSPAVTDEMLLDGLKTKLLNETNRRAQANGRDTLTEEEREMLMDIQLNGLKRD
jgi:hypothetical protein